MQHEEPDETVLPAHNATTDWNAPQVAATSVATWRDVFITLSPIIGERGFSALFKRSIHLTCTVHPWLIAVYDDSALAGNFSVLQSALAQQTSAHAAAANDALLRNFINLLGSLIGESLTQRILRSVLDQRSNGAATRDK